jgi:hypothetical protein
MLVCWLSVVVAAICKQFMQQGHPCIFSYQLPVKPLQLCCVACAVVVFLFLNIACKRTGPAYNYTNNATVPVVLLWFVPCS